MARLGRSFPVRAQFLRAAPPSVVAGAATLTGSGALAATGKATIFATGTLTGSGALAATGRLVVVGSAALTGSGALAATGLRAVRGSAVLEGGAAEGASYVDEVLADGPAFYYRLGESSGTAAVDEMGSANGVYVNTPTLGEAGALTGDADTAIHLNDAQDEYVDLAGLIDHDPANPGSYNLGLTMEIWAKADIASDGLDQCIIGTWESAATGGPMLWRDHLTGKLWGTWRAVGFSGWIDTGHTPDGDWHHYVYTFDFPTKIVSVYVDGELTDTADPSADGPFYLGQSESFHIGYYGTGAVGYFAGWTDEAAFYEYALTPERIAAHYERGVNGPVAGEGLTGDGEVVRQSAAALIGSGSLVADGVVTAGATVVVGAAALSGSGSLAASGTFARQGTGMLVGGGTLVATGVTARSGAATLTGAGTLAASGRKGVSIGATLSGTGVLSATGVRATSAASALTGTGTLAGTGRRGIVGAAALAGLGSLVGEWSAGVKSGSAHLVATGLLSASGVRITFGGAQLAGAGALLGGGQAARSSSAALSGAGVLVSVGQAVRSGEASLGGSGALSASGHLLRTGSAALVGSGFLLAAADQPMSAAVPSGELAIGTLGGLIDGSGKIGALQPGQGREGRLVGAGAVGALE